MARRLLITDLAAADMQLLANAILQYVDDGVLREHENGHGWHHAGNPAFFIGHRQYIGKLANRLIMQRLDQFVPLPKWDPATQIPDPF